jgi:hypothetical protein
MAIDFGKRRFLLSTAASLSLLAVDRKVLAASALRNSSVVWSPATLCGLNMGYGEFWGRDIAPGQYDVLARYGCTFVRGMFFSYLLGSYKPGQLDPAVQNIAGMEPYAADPAQLSLFCQSLTYEPPAGDRLVLSAPLTYRAANGAALTLPAKTPLTITGSAKARDHDAQGFLKGGEIRVRPTGHTSVIPNNGKQPVTDVEVLHLNFYREGKTLRKPIDEYVKRVQQWLSQGFVFDHGGWHDNWYDLFVKFGQSNVQPMREQEWDFFAGLNWDPARVLINDENEPVWPRGKVSPAEKWNLYKPYFKDVLYPRMRHHFPQHTLGFGTPDWDGVATALHMDWWPSDKNTLLRVHYYPGQGDEGIWKIDPHQRPELDSMMDKVAGLQNRLKIPDIYFQEYGIRWDHPNRSAALQNIRKAIQVRGWPCAVWSASINPPKADSFLAVSLDEHKLWRPVESALGAFGTN